MKLYTKRSLKNLKSGFSLVEMLVVMGIIAIIMVMTVGGMDFIKNKQKKSELDLRLKVIEKGLQDYYNLYDTYPESTDEMDGAELLFQELFALPVENDEKPFVAQMDPQSKNGSYSERISGRSVVIDPWGNPLIYRFPAQDGSDTFDLGSLGADGVPSEDDQNNWTVE